MLQFIHRNSFLEMLYIGDLGVTRIEIFNDFTKVYFQQKNNTAVECVIYMNVKGNILNRFLLMYPGKNALKLFDEEVNSFFKNIVIGRMLGDNCIIF